MAKANPTLDEYAAATSPSAGPWYTKLPEEVRTQILGSTATVKVVVAWLRELGYHDATESKVRKLTEQRRG